MNTLTWDNGCFMLDGRPFVLHSAAMHYFRIPPEYWRDRLQKLADCGFNTLETYTCWNLHERRPGEFDFSGLLDLERYLQTAASLGLKVLLRPGPYICAEWEAGGLPSWLLRERVPLRCADERFMAVMRRWLTQLFGRIRPYLATNGGPILMLQVENEYGSFGDDTGYLRALADLYRELGIDVPLYTADGTCAWMLSGGTIPGVLAAANFGSHPRDNFAALRAFRPGQPLFCGEFWSGWFDHWYEPHHTRTQDSTLADVREMVQMGASFNLYMFHGGTNFGFWNGANHGQGYEPTVTSYDYCAPLNECGDPTPTYFALQKLLCGQEGRPVPPPPAPVRRAGYGTVELTESLLLRDALPVLARPVPSPVPLTFEELGLDFGYVLYASTLHGPFEELELTFGALHDRAHVFVNGQLRGIEERGRRSCGVRLALAAGESARLEILVENMGRINYGPQMFDEKGILGGVRLGQRYHFGWEMVALPMENLSSLPFEAAVRPFDGRPVFLRGRLRVNGRPADTFVRPEGFGKGFVCVNGFNLGRYYNAAGPQRTLYLPGALLHEGENEIVVFETDACAAPRLRFEKEMDLGPAAEG